MPWLRSRGCARPLAVRAGCRSHGRSRIWLERGHRTRGSYVPEVGARSGPTFREVVLMHAVARLVLHRGIRKVQTSWVKMGASGAALCLEAGANDLGGTLMNESITRAAGGVNGQEFDAASLAKLVVALRRRPRQRTTLYRAVADESGPTLLENRLENRLELLNEHSFERGGS